MMWVSWDMSSWTKMASHSSPPRWITSTEDQGQWDGAGPDAAESGQEDHHEHDAGGAQQGGAREEREVDQPGHQGGEQDGQQ